MATAAKHHPKHRPAAKTAARPTKTVPKPKPEERSTMAEHKPDPFVAPPPPHAAPAPHVAAPVSTSVVAADMLTEQEKDTTSETPGVGPASPSEHSPGPVETMEDLGIGPREPYPEGNPWVPPLPEEPVAAAKKKDPAQ
jgi:hypothetical protein